MRRGSDDWSSTFFGMILDCLSRWRYMYVADRYDEQPAEEPKAGTLQRWMWVVCPGHSHQLRLSWNSITKVCILAGPTHLEERMHSLAIFIGTASSDRKRVSPPRSDVSQSRHMLRPRSFANGSDGTSCRRATIWYAARWRTRRPMSGHEEPL